MIENLDIVAKGVIGLLFGIIGWVIKRGYSRTDELYRIVEENDNRLRKSIEENDNKLRDSIIDLHLDVAKNYIAKEDLAKFKSEMVTYLTRLEDKIDKLK